MKESYLRIAVVLLGYVVLASVLYAGLVEPVFPFARDLNLLVPAIVVLATLRPTPAIAIVVFLAGLLYDASIGLVLGPQAGAAVISWVLLSLVASRLFLESRTTALILAAAAALLFSIARLALTLQFIPAAVQGISSVLIGVVLSATAAVVIAPTLRKLMLPRASERGRGERNFIGRTTSR